MAKNLNIIYLKFGKYTENQYYIIVKPTNKYV